MSDNTYFSAAPEGMELGEPGWWNFDRDLRPQEVLPGLTFQPVVGRNLAVNLVHFSPHISAPRHAHSEEQVVIVLEGEVEFEVDGETRTLGPRDVLVIPPWSEHAARTHGSSCTCIDAFSPPRQGLEDIMRAATGQ